MSENVQIKIFEPKMCFAPPPPTKSCMLYNFCFAKVLPSCMLKAA